MIFLISYDIESNKVRLKIANKLLEYGLERIQYSVFLGKIKKSLIKPLKGELTTIFQKADPQKDKLLILPLSQRQIKRYIALGDSPDMEYLCGELLVLIL